MPEQYKYDNNTLRIRVGLSSDPNSIDNISEIGDNEHYHVIEISHARTDRVNIHIKGETDSGKIRFKRDQSEQEQWECETDIDPNFVDKRQAQRTEPIHESAKILVVTPDDSDEIVTTVKNKNNSASDYRNCNCDFIIRT